MARIKEYYDESVVSALREKFKYENPMQVPALKKIVVTSP